MTGPGSYLCTRTVAWRFSLVVGATSGTIPRFDIRASRFVSSEISRRSVVEPPRDPYRCTDRIPKLWRLTVDSWQLSRADRFLKGTAWKFYPAFFGDTAVSIFLISLSLRLLALGFRLRSKRKTQRKNAHCCAVFSWVRFALSWLAVVSRPKNTQIQSRNSVWIAQLYLH